MAMKYTEEQLNKFDKATLVKLFLATQEQLESIDSKLQLVLEQLAVANSKRFGRSSEKMAPDNQIAFMEVDGKLVFFNEAEAVAAITEYDENEPVKQRSKKAKGKRSLILADLPTVEISHKMTEEELIREFGDNGWYQLKDEIYNRYRFTPAKIEIEEHHIGVYRSKKDNHFKKADHPAYLLRNSLVSPFAVSRDIECQVCERCSIVPLGAGVCPLWSGDQPPRDGSLDDTLYGKISVVDL